MAHAFKIISAKSTFGTLQTNLNQSDYINRKKGIMTFCKYSEHCQKIKNASSYNIINSFNIGRNALTLDKCHTLPVNKTNLIVSQYSKLDLNGVCTVSPLSTFTQTIDPCGSQPCDGCQDPSNPVIIPNPPASDLFYEKYIIDPFGQLFGKTQCGELNYTHYIVLKQ